MKSQLLESLMDARAARTPVALATNLHSGQQALIFAGETRGELCLDIDMIAAAGEALRRDRATVLATPLGEVFVQVFNPPPRLVIVGAVHIAQPLARMGALAGYAVTLIDPRSGFAGSQTFADYEVLGDWPDEALERLGPDQRTAIVTLTHDPKLDDPALASALRSHAFYVGALGSRKTHAARLDRLKALGFTEHELERIRGPVGLDIGAESPAEIAVSILAEITAIRRRQAAP